jgi:hypothetical protein
VVGRHKVGGERDVLVVDFIDLVYTTFGEVRLVLGVDDTDKACAAL